MSDLVERLRTNLVMSMFIGKNDLYQQSEAEREEAANRIEQLETDNARMLEALKPFSDMTGELFARNREAADVVMALDNPNDMHRLTFQDFLAATAALESKT